MLDLPVYSFTKQSQVSRTMDKKLFENILRKGGNAGTGLFFFIGRGRDPRPPSWGKMHLHRGKFIIRYQDSLLLIFKHNVSIHN